MIQLLLEGQPGSEVTVSVVRPRKAAPDKIALTRDDADAASGARRRCMRIRRFCI